MTESIFNKQDDEETFGFFKKLAEINLDKLTEICNDNEIKVGPNDDLPFIANQEIKDELNLPKNKEFKRDLIRSVLILESRRILPFNKTKSEVIKIRNVSLNVDDYENVDTEINMLSRLINDIDADRTRLSELLSQAQSDLLWIKKTHERLYAEWVGKYSEQKSDKKREGEAEEILNFFFNERMKRDEIFNLIKNKYDLLNSKLELVSRKITIALDNRKIFAGVNAEHDSNTKYRAEFKKKKDNTEFELPKMSEDSNLIDRLLEE